MRTSAIDIARLAWALWRHPYRNHLRIGQILMNAVVRAGMDDIFYTENRDLLAHVKSAEQYWKALGE